MKVLQLPPVLERQVVEISTRRLVELMRHLTLRIHRAQAELCQGIL